MGKIKIKDALCAEIELVFVFGLEVGSFNGFDELGCFLDITFNQTEVAYALAQQSVAFDVQLDDLLQFLSQLF